MGYKALVNSNVNKVFNLVKDLAEDVVLLKKASSSYSFSTLTATVTESPSLITKAIITDVRKNSREKNTITKVVLLKTAEIGEVSAYDKITYNSQTWLIGNIITSDNFVTALEMSREGGFNG